MPLLSYIATYSAGAGSTVVGSWVASKIRVYHDARNSHLDELKAGILQPLLQFLQSHDGEPQFSVDWGPQLYNPNARAQEQPTTAGPVLNVCDSAFNVYAPLNDALLEDSQRHHFIDLLSDCEDLRASWAAHASLRKEWIEDMGQRLLNASGLPAFTEGHRAPHIMHLSIAHFIYSRLMEGSQITLGVAENHSPPSLMVAKLQIVASAETTEKIREVLSLVNALLNSEKPRAIEFQTKAADLQSRRSSVARKFSLALASKKLPHRCPLVTFR